MKPEIPDHANSLNVEPIGFVRTSASSRIEAPRQPGAAVDVMGRIELFPGNNFEHALQDLDGWDYIWVVFWFHLNTTWRPKVLPPRSSSGRKGVFATRAPYRPNPIGLSALKLERIDGLTLHVRGVDMLDGTPVLDLKPYVPYTDAYPAARSGWLDDAGQRQSGASPADPVSPCLISFSPLALEQASWIEAHTGLAIHDRIVATLSLGAEPHPYRRIRREEDMLRLAVKEWRIHFRLDSTTVLVETISSGYRAAQLAMPDNPLIETHRLFTRAFAR